jgi:hypothetical protein
MPIEAEEWESGEEAQSRYEQILDLLRHHPDKAYSVEEVSDHLGFVDTSNRSIIVDRLVQMHLSCKLEWLVYDGEIAVKRVSGEKHYRIDFR